MEKNIPTGIVGKDHTISHITKQPIIAVPFQSDNGEFTIEACFEESEELIRRSNL